MIKTKIEWVLNPDGTPGYTSNPIKGMCPHFGREICGSYCYVQTKMPPYVKEMYSGPLTFHPKELAELSKKRRKPRTVFVGDMIDIWADAIDMLRIEEIGLAAKMGGNAVLFCTKNPSRYSRFLCIENVFYLTTITTQHDADARIPELLKLNTPNIGLSIEPLLGPIDLTRVIYKKTLQLEEERHHCRVSINALSGLVDDGWDSWHEKAKIAQIIIGAMTGPGAVPPQREWVESLIEQADAAGVKVFVKDNLSKLFPDLPKRRELAWKI